MRLQVLHVPDCPGAEALDSLLGPLLAARPDIEVTRQVVSTEGEAERLGMTRSPTILADGRDLFPSQVQQPSLSGRLYPGDPGQLDPSTHRRPASGGTYASRPPIAHVTAASPGGRSSYPGRAIVVYCERSRSQVMRFSRWVPGSAAI
jgi:hypothetical protein